LTSLTSEYAREMVWLAVLSRAAEAGLPGLIFTFAFDRTVRTTFIPRVQTAVAGNGGQVIFVKTLVGVALRGHPFVEY
jgi:hypothetical protein